MTSAVSGFRCACCIWRSPTASVCGHFSFLVPPRSVLPPRGRPMITGMQQDDSFGLRWLLRQRLKWVRDALPGDRFATVLEIGYGDGACRHELAKHASHVYGSDLHARGADVRRRLTCGGVIPHLVRNASDALPFCDDAFDAVVIVSSLERMRDPATALREAVRVVRSGGAVV